MTEYASPSPEAEAIRDALEDLHAAQAQTKIAHWHERKATKRLHGALKALSDKHNLDPEVMVTGGPGGNKPPEP